MSSHYAAELAQLKEAGHLLVTVQDIEIGIYWVDGEIHAWRSICPHRGVSICKGRRGGTHLPSAVYEYRFGMENSILRCPLHAWEFDLATGQSLHDARVKLRRYNTEIRNDQIWVYI